jgi:hypothetical protein
VLLQDESEVPKLHRWLATRIAEAIGNETAAADKIMDWLKAASKLLDKHKIVVDPRGARLRVGYGPTRTWRASRSATF